MGWISGRYQALLEDIHVDKIIAQIMIRDSIRTRFFLFTRIVALLLAIWLGLYLIVRNVDPEGACKEPRYFSLCLDAWMSHAEFRALPSDRELIDTFHQHRAEFEKVMRPVLIQRARHQPILSFDAMSYSKLNVFFGYIFVKYFAATQGPARAEMHANSLYFAASGTKHIYSADKDMWPWVWKDKGYVYFFDGPYIENGRVWMHNKVPLPDRSFRLVKSLDDVALKQDETLLMQIEPQWFLYLSNQHTGG
ncbi:MAG: hypothetical protein ACKVN9_05330 [Methylophilaceae bacterium]